MHQKRTKPATQTGTSPFVQLTAGLWLPLSPCAYNFPLEGLCAEHISPHLLGYFEKFHGVLLSYSNPRITEELSQGVHSNGSDQLEAVLTRSINEYAVSYVALTAEFLIFRPERGTILEGYVNLHSESVLGLICYNYFNASIEREKLPKDWTWGEEHWLDGKGNAVAGLIQFKVEDYEASGQDGISISGALREG